MVFEISVSICWRRMSFVDKLYRGIFRRTSTFALACIGGAFVFERGFDLTAETIFENMNRGVGCVTNIFVVACLWWGLLVKWNFYCRNCGSTLRTSIAKKNREHPVILYLNLFDCTHLDNVKSVVSRTQLHENDFVGIRRSGRKIEQRTLTEFFQIV